MGRPLKTPEAGKRASLGLKVTRELKLKIEEAARLSGRTQSQEAELRLEKSFFLEETVAAAVREVLKNV